MSGWGRGKRVEEGNIGGGEYCRKEERGRETERLGDGKEEGEGDGKRREGEGRGGGGGRVEPLKLKSFLFPEFNVA